MIEQLLETELTGKNGTFKVKNLPLDAQIEFLTSETNFPVFASKESKLWRLEHLYWIINKNQQKVLFKLNSGQKHFFENILEKGYKRIIICKSRQIGFTTLIAMYFLDEVLFTPNTEALQIFHTIKDATDIFSRKIKFSVNNLSQNIRNLVEMNTKRANRIEFGYGDNSTSAISVSGSGRSGTYNMLHISELAKLSKNFPERANEVITGTMPSLPQGSLCIIESTAEGMNGIFYEIFSNAWKRRHLITPQSSRGEFYPVFYNWQFDTEEVEKANQSGILSIEEMEEGEVDWNQYQIDFGLSNAEISYYYLKWLQLNKDLDRLHQEYPTTELECFIGTGANFFSLKRIFNYMQGINDKLWTRYSFLNNEFYVDKDGDMWIKQEPENGKQYIIGGDVAQGLEHGDNSALTVIGLDKEIKAFYRGHCEPDVLSKLAQVLGRKYNNALLVIESNMDGNWVNSDIVNSNYPNIYLRTSFDDITKTMTSSYGWNTNSNTRKNLLDNMKVWFNSRTEINCRLLLEEMQFFVRNKNGKPMSISPNKDDFIMATGIALAVIGLRKDVLKDVKPKSLLDFVYA